MDLELIETNNGGDLIKNKKDLSVIHGFENMPYLALFGGCVLQSTPSKRLQSEQVFDYWGNKLLMDNDPSIQFNSLTERTLMKVSLTSSSGRVQIEEAVKSDLAFMKEFCEVTVNVVIVSNDKIIIGIRLKEPDNLQGKEFVYIWDATNQELTNRLK